MDGTKLSAFNCEEGQTKVLKMPTHEDCVEVGGKRRSRPVWKGDFAIIQRRRTLDTKVTSCELVQRNEHRWTIGKETQDNSCAHVYSPGYRYGVTDSLYGAADIGSRYGLVPGPIRVLSARQARAAAVVFTPQSSGQPIGWRCLKVEQRHPQAARSRRSSSCALPRQDSFHAVERLSSKPNLHAGQRPAQCSFTYLYLSMTASW